MTYNLCNNIGSYSYWCIKKYAILCGIAIKDYLKFNDVSSRYINYKILKTHNQWLRDKKLDNPTKKVYEIEIPTEGYNQ